MDRMHGCRVGVTAVLLAAFLTGCTNASAPKGDNSLQKVMDAGQLVMGLDANYPPMGYTDENGDITGFDVDMAREVCKRLGVELVPHPIRWDKKEEELNNGTVDCIWSGMSATSERAESMNLSDPYLRSELIFVVRNDSQVCNMKELKGCSIGVQSGSTTKSFLETSDLKEDITIVTFDDNLEVMQSLKDGELDAICIDSINAYYCIATSDERFFVLPEVFGEEELAIGFRKGDQELRDKVQKTISDMKADGTLKEISVKWFGSDITIVK